MARCQMFTRTIANGFVGIAKIAICSSSVCIRTITAVPPSPRLNSQNLRATIDPAEIGREYRGVIRADSPSGEGGVEYLLASQFGVVLPTDMQREFGSIDNDAVDELGRELTGADLKQMSWGEYIKRTSPW